MKTQNTKKADEQRAELAKLQKRAEVLEALYKYSCAEKQFKAKTQPYTNIIDKLARKYEVSADFIEKDNYLFGYIADHEDTNLADDVVQRLVMERGKLEPFYQKLQKAAVEYIEVETSTHLGAWCEYDIKFFNKWPYAIVVSNSRCHDSFKLSEPFKLFPMKGGEANE